jgi:hypothetical protein
VRGQLLDDASVRDHLRTSTCTLAIADMGHPLRWFDGDARFEVWKAELQPRLVAPEVASRGFKLENFPDERCYLASEWRSDQAPVSVLFESYH